MKLESVQIKCGKQNKDMKQYGTWLLLRNFT